jgi:hypothetical protein
MVYSYTAQAIKVQVLAPVVKLRGRTGMRYECLVNGVEYQHHADLRTPTMLASFRDSEMGKRYTDEQFDVPKVFGISVVVHPCLETIWVRIDRSKTDGRHTWTQETGVVISAVRR